MDLLGVARAVLGLAILAWLPGYAWTRALTPRLAPIERFVLSVAMSVALVTLAIVGSNLLLGLPVSGLNAVLLALAISACALAPAALRRVPRRGAA